MLNLLSLIWGFGESCKIDHGITSQLAYVLPKIVILTFLTSFRPPFLEVKGKVGVGIGPFHSLPVGSY